MQTFYLVLANAILVVHALIVTFNLGALPVIWIGRVREWSFVRNFYFRAAHLLLIGLVAAESVLGTICPLTTWEDTLRSKAGAAPVYQTGYLAHWLHQLIFYDLDAWVFIAGYLSFFALVLLTFLWVKPRPPRWWTPPPRPEQV